jgi:hypothetical protein
MTPAPDAVQEFLGRLEAAAERPQQAELKRQFCQAWQLSPSTLSRLLHANGRRAHARTDRGVPRKAGIDQLKIVLALQAASTSLRKGDIMPAGEAIRLAEQNGYLDQGTLSEDTFNRWLREQGISRKQRNTPRPHVQLASKGPNHVHQVDFSLATNWVMGRNGIEWERYAEDDTKLAAAAGKARLWRLITVDHASGAFWPFYGAYSGETVNMLLEGLYATWTEKFIGGESIMRQMPFRGVPHTLMFDRGSSTKSQVTKNVLTRLGVQMIESQSARAKGSVEVHHGIWENIFESKMRLERPSSIAQLNDWAADYATGYCARQRHTRTHMTRVEAWVRFINRNEESRLRELKCDLRTFLAIALTNPVTRRVNGGRFSFEGREYRVPSSLVHNERIWVQFSPYDFPAVQIRGDESAEAAAFVCEPIQKDHLGFALDAPVIGVSYASHALSAASRTMDAARSVTEELAKGQGLKVFGQEIQHVENALYVPKGDELPMETRESYHSREAAVRIVREAFGGRDFTTAERELLADWTERVADAEIDAMISLIEKGVQGRVLELRRNA